MGIIHRRYTAKTANTPQILNLLTATMATVHLYLDKRSVKRGNEAPLKIGINKQGSSAYISLNVRIYPTQWDAEKERIKDHPNKKALQSYIDTQRNKVSNIIMDLTKEGKLTKLTATQIKNKVVEVLEPSVATSNSFYNRFINYAKSRSAQRTKDIYLVTAKRMLEYDSRIKSKTFEDITKDWLTGFDMFLQKYSSAINGRNIHFRNIRAVFNDALDNEITQNYPFRVFKIKAEQTEKRSLTLSEVRELFAIAEPNQKRTIDLFKLSLFLIGINIADLCELSEIDGEGRINYKRKKTKRLYSIKVEPEALEIINRYKGDKYLLDILETHSNTHAFTTCFDRQLKKVGPCELKKNPGFSKTHRHEYIREYKPLFPRLSSYWARHTWATLASELDIPEDVISHALGHSYSTGAAVTQVYINFSRKKIDDANRKVIDYILGINAGK